MKNCFLAITAASIIWGVAGCASPSRSNILPEHESPRASAPKKTMRSFGSEQELTSYFRQLVEKQKQESLRRATQYSAAPAPATAMKLSAGVAQEESVTNVQHAGVDEGGIVKVHGNHLVVLRRGRLFTVAIGDGALEPISSVDAFAPDIDPRSTWYDEMLVSEVQSQSSATATNAAAQRSASFKSIRRAGSAIDRPIIYVPTTTIRRATTPAV